MKDQDNGQLPNKFASEKKERYEQEKSEDERRYRDYLQTGKCISNEAMMMWFDQLEQIADSKASTE